MANVFREFVDVVSHHDVKVDYEERCAKRPSLKDPFVIAHRASDFPVAFRDELSVHVSRSDQADAIPW